MTQKITNILKVVILFIPLVSLRAQDANRPSELLDYSAKYYRLNHRGMVVLTAWASANIISGGVCFITTVPEEKYFYGMNAAWGAVNLAIAIPGLLSKKPTYNSKQEMFKKQLKTEKIFLINAALDMVYIGAGFGLKEVSKNQTDNNFRAMFSGFGNSFILQGGGLLVFDIGMVLLNKGNRKKHLSKIMQNTEISFYHTGINLRHKF